MNFKSENLLHDILSRRNDLIDLTQKLIKIPTLNPPGNNYLEICEYLKTRMEINGFITKLIRAYDTPGDSDKFPRWNLVCSREGGLQGKTVHFNGHTDVVETGKGWTVDPFEGRCIDGLVYGRGACDMKGGIASSIIAVESFISLFPNYPGKIEFSFTADEETGGYGGVAYLASKGYFSPSKVNSVIIPEPLNKDRICLGHRGVWWAEIETFGRIAHGSMPFLGDSAIRHMGAVLKEFEEKLYPKLQTIKTKMPVVPDGAKTSTMNINSIHGGEVEQEEDFSGYPAAVVADSCKIIIDRRFLIEESINNVKKDIKGLLDNLETSREGFRYKISDLHEVIPTMADKNSHLVSELSNSIKEIIGVQPDYVISPGTYDQKHIERIGKLKNCVAYGPGILDLAHQPDEYISVDDMLDSAKVMAISLEGLLK